MSDAVTWHDLTLPGFLAWEERQRQRYERVAGVVRMMAGGTLDHDKIANNIRALLLRALRGGSCDLHGPDVKVRSPLGDVFYPDALVRCGPIDGRATSIEDPVVVIEVLSESTAAWDLSRKRLAYKAIPSLRAILYVAQDTARIDIVRRDVDGRWDDGDPAEGRDAVLALPEIGATLALAEVYEGTGVGRGEQAPP